jgi:glycosyltransferase involved in cell wall biosynthesis
VQRTGTTERIGLIAPPWVPVPPPAYGGTEAVIDRLARGFVAAGHDVLLFTTGDATCPVSRQWVVNRADPARMGSAVVELHHLVHAYGAMQDCDIIHDHTVIGPTYALHFPSLTVVTTNHGPFNAELISVYRAVAERVPIIAISHSQAATAVDLRIARVIHHGIDPDAFPMGAGDGGYFAFLGRVVPDKGIRQAALVAREAGVRLLIAAKMQEPLEIEYFEDQVRPLLTRDVEYIGEVGDGEKLELLNGARALINPIRWPEPFGLVMIEALACGTPVIAFPAGAAPEIVAHGVTGFLCTDEADMVQSLGRVDELSRSACRAAVERSFSTARMVADHIDLFSDVLARGWSR